MVGSEEVGKSLGAAQGAAGDAAQALTAIPQTQYLRYLIIASWAVGLLATVGWVEASVWFCGTVAAGAVRGAFERRMAHKVTAGWGLVFPAIATVTTAAWASAPLLAWFSGHAFGHSLAAALLIGGYVLVFSQLRSSPKQAIVISSPYSVVAVIILASAWGTPNFWPFLAIMPFTAAGLFVLVTMTMLREERIKAFSTVMKLEPFQRGMRELAPTVWITALRQVQNPNRAGLDIVSPDGNFGSLKLSPLFYWSDAQMEAYLKENDLPNEWDYFDPAKADDKRECGLHAAWGGKAVASAATA